MAAAALSACSGESATSEAPDSTSAEAVTSDSTVPGSSVETDASGTAQCGATTLSVQLDQIGDAATGPADCFFDRLAAGGAAEWEVVVLTESGDPVLLRYELDADGSVKILTDATRDSFGPAESVLIEVCDEISSDRSLLPPSGTGCEPDTDTVIDQLPLPEDA